MKKTILIITMIMCCGSALAQTVRGTVFYTNGEKTGPLPFAQIYDIAEKKLYETDENGRFALEIRSKATLVATYVGYTKDTLTVEPGIAEIKFFLTGENGLDESVITGKQATLSKIKPVKTEVITSAGLCKMACCALAESFENSASVTVGYSDAVTGARQIKLLGLSGTYTQMLDENRPVMRGIANSFGMSFIPGQWLESIQIAKGPSSVINGLEAITGQINMEHRKPTDETPLFVQVYGSTDQMYETNVASAIQLNQKWSVVNMAHIGLSNSIMDHNDDGFRDDPQDKQLNFNSRWFYYAPNGIQIRFGAKLLNDNRIGGQTDFRKEMGRNSSVWGSNIINRGINPYLKIGIPLNEENSANIALVADFNHHELDSYFGMKSFTGEQNSAFANLIYQNEFTENHKIELGLTTQYDNLKQFYSDLNNWQTVPECYPGLTAGSHHDRKETAVSTFAEYTFTAGEKLTFVGGLNLEYNTFHGKWLFAPRANVKYSVTESIVLRALAGRGYRTANIFTDNLGLFSTNRILSVDRRLNLLEDAWTLGGNATFYLPFGADDDTYLSFDYFRSQFNNQVVADQECNSMLACIYNPDGQSYTNTYQVDFSVSPFEGFTTVATFRYTDAKTTLRGQGLVEAPMTSRFKGVLNLQYATRMNIWTIDFTAQLNGPMRLPDFAAESWKMNESPVYPILYAQITRKLKGIDLYAGVENITGYRQKDAIIGLDENISSSRDFNASCVWGPLMGAKAYIGLRYTLWKQ